MSLHLKCSRQGPHGKDLTFSMVLLGGGENLKGGSSGEDLVPWTHVLEGGGETPTPSSLSFACQLWSERLCHCVLLFTTGPGATGPVNQSWAMSQIYLLFSWVYFLRYLVQLWKADGTTGYAMWVMSDVDKVFKDMQSIYSRKDIR